MNSKVKNIYLIGGTGRSGTTILTKLLGDLDQLTNVPEWRFLTDPNGVIDFYNYTALNYCSPFHYDSKVKEFSNFLNDLINYNSASALLASNSIRKLSQTYFAQNISARYGRTQVCLLYTSPSPRDRQKSRMPSSA